MMVFSTEKGDGISSITFLHYTHFFAGFCTRWHGYIFCKGDKGDSVANEHSGNF